MHPASSNASTTANPSPAPVTRSAPPLNIAIVGAGLAGSLCAQHLQAAGHHVQVWDKSRGPGGRLATRRATWTAADGQTLQAAWDHGTPAFRVQTPAAQAWVQGLLDQGRLTAWADAATPGDAADDAAAGWVLPVPDLPGLCRQALAAVPLHTGVAVDALARGANGWRLLAAGELLADGLDQVWLALPPAQAAHLLAPHAPAWAATAQGSPMSPVWTLMAATPVGAAAPAKAAWRPAQGPLGWVMRQDRRPGRSAPDGLRLWVAHARPDWSAEHLELPAEQALVQLQAALASALGEAQTWVYSTAHRWRYALPAQCASALQPGRAWPLPTAGAPLAWWAPTLGLGVCGDFLSPAGLHAVEGAWLSAQALCGAAARGEAVGPA